MMGLSEVEQRGLRCLRDCGCIIVQDTADARAKYAELVRRGHARWQWHKSGVLRVTYAFGKARAMSVRADTKRPYQGWSADEENRLSELVAEGWSWGAIANDIGRTKNSCVGRWGRMCADRKRAA